MTASSLSKLSSERLKIAQARKRPAKCLDCPLNPLTPGYDPLFGGGFVAPFGPMGAPLTVIGIVPAEEEEVRGEPLTGPSGRWVESALDWGSEGAPPLLRKLNVVNCRSTKVGIQGKIVNRIPTAREAHFCMEQFLLPEIAENRSTLYFFLGTDAFKDVFEDAFGKKYGNAMGHRLLIPRSFFSSPLVERRKWIEKSSGKPSRRAEGMKAKLSRKEFDAIVKKQKSL